MSKQVSSCLGLLVFAGVVAYSSVTLAQKSLGVACSAHAECATGRCDNRPGAGCVAPDGTGNSGQFCTTHQQCRTGLCNVPAGKIAGLCSGGNRPLGQACSTHQECSSGRCDNRPGAGCVAPDGTGNSGQFCTTHQQCRTGVCNVPSGKISGQCSANSRPLGTPCVSHAECSSGRCDNRPGAGCVAHDGQGNSGEFCTTHQQCKTATCIVPSGKVAGQCASALPAVTPATYRKYYGFSFANTKRFQELVGGYGFEDLVELYGRCAVSMGALNPALPGVPCVIPEPSAVVYAKILDETLKDGQCFGFSLVSLKFRNRDRSLLEFPMNSGGFDVWHLKGIEFDSGTNVSPSLARYIHLQHALQASTESLTAVAKQAAAAHSPTILKGYVTDAMARGGAIVSMFDGKAGHTVVAYSTTNLSNGDYAINVYDPNRPWSPGENTPLVESQSRIMVHPNNTYEFSQSGVSHSGGLDQLYVLPYDSFKVQTPASNIGNLLFFFGTVSGSGGRLTQIDDGQGHTLLTAAGLPNTDPKTRLPGSVVVPFGEKNPDGRVTYLLDPKGSYTQTIDNTRNGSYRAYMVGQTLTVQLDNVQAVAGHKDTLSLPAGGREIGLRTTAPKKSFALQLHTKLNDKTVRTVQVTGTTGGGDPVEMGFDGAQKDFTYRHRGPAAKVQFRLSHFDNGKNTDLAVSPVDVQPGDEVTLKPAWKDLTKAAAGELLHSTAKGVRNQRTLKR